MRTAQWKHIMVVVTDPFARDQWAAAKAATVARRTDAKVVLFNTFMIPQPVGDVAMDAHDRIIETAIEQRRERLAAIAAQVRLPASTRCIVRWDYPIHEAIVRQVRRLKPDVLITDSHRHGRLARIVLANTDWELMRDCPCPLWFVRSAELPRSPRWLVAVDPRHTHAKPAKLDDRLIRTARRAVAQLGGRVSIVHAYEAPLSATPGMLLEPVRWPIAPQRSRDFVAHTTHSVFKLAEKHGVNAKECIVREGEASNVIAAEAKRLRADVLMMGAVSRRRLSRPVIGATAERVIDHVDCDVFIVKPAGFKTRAKRPMAEAT